MNEREIIKTFISKGSSLDSAVLDYFSSNPSSLNKFMEKEREYPAIITMDYVKKSIGKDEYNVDLIEIGSNHLSSSKRDVKDALSTEREKYGAYKDAISDKMSSMMSINRTDSLPSFSLIVLVAEKEGERKIIAEDPTGFLKITLGEADYDSLIEGDVIGLECVRKPDGIFGNRVVFPDVPLKRDIRMSESEIKCVFYPSFGDIPESILKDHIVFVFSDSIDERENVFLVSDPVIANIGGIKILLFDWENIKDYSKYWGKSEEVLVNLIKRRSLSPGSKMGERGFWNDLLFIDHVPDIVVTNSGEYFSSNYKGTSIISVGKNTAVTADLRTREINKVDLS